MSSDEVGVPSVEEIKGRASLEDRILNKLETLCSLFDNLYLLKSIGIINESNFFFQKINKSTIGSKIWFVTLLLSIRKSIKQLIKNIKIRNQFIEEIKNFNLNHKHYVNDIVSDRLEEGLKKCKITIREAIFDLIQNFIYLIIVAFQAFRIKGYNNLKRSLDPMFTIVSIVRLMSTGYAIIN